MPKTFFPFLRTVSWLLLWSLLALHLGNKEVTFESDATLSHKTDEVTNVTRQDTPSNTKGSREEINDEKKTSLTFLTKREAKDYKEMEPGKDNTVQISHVNEKTQMHLAPVSKPTPSTTSPTTPNPSQAISPSVDSSDDLEDRSTTSKKIIIEINASVKSRNEQFIQFSEDLEIEPEDSLPRVFSAIERMLRILYKYLRNAIEKAAQQVSLENSELGQAYEGSNVEHRHNLGPTSAENEPGTEINAEKKRLVSPFSELQQNMLNELIFLKTFARNKLNPERTDPSSEQREEKDRVLSSQEPLSDQKNNGKLIESKSEDKKTMDKAGNANHRTQPGEDMKTVQKSSEDRFGYEKNNPLAFDLTHEINLQEMHKVDHEALTQGCPLRRIIFWTKLSVPFLTLILLSLAGFMGYRRKQKKKDQFYTDFGYSEF